MKIKFTPLNLLAAAGLAFAIRHFVITKGVGSISAALFGLFEFVMLPFRLALSLYAALGSGLTLRGWAAIEFETWRLRRRGELFVRRQYRTHRRTYSPPQVDIERQIIEGTNEQALILIGGATQGRDFFLSGASLDDIRRSQH